MIILEDLQTLSSTKLYPTNIRICIMTMDDANNFYTTRVTLVSFFGIYSMYAIVR